MTIYLIIKDSFGNKSVAAARYTQKSAEQFKTNAEADIRAGEQAGKYTSMVRYEIQPIEVT